MTDKETRRLLEDWGLCASLTPSKEQKYFVRTTRLFCQTNQQILLSQQMIFLGQQNSFVRSTEHFYYINRTVLLE